MKTTYVSDGGRIYRYTLSQNKYDFQSLHGAWLSHSNVRKGR